MSWLERMRAARARAVERARWLWSHRTKASGVMIGAGGYVQAHQDQLGLFLPAAIAKWSLMAAGGIVFAIGLYNTMCERKAAQ